jgi:hypothetical protein
VVEPPDQPQELERRMSAPLLRPGAR